MFSLGLSNASLSLAPQQYVYFVHPLDLDDSHTTACDTIVEGVVTLVLRKPTRVPRLSVRLVGHAEVHVDGQVYSEGTTFDRDVVLKTSSGNLPKGEHRFAFNLAIPTSTATIQERCQHGRIWHKLIATADGLGLLGTPLISEAILWLIASPSIQGLPPPPLDIQVEGIGDIGLFRISLESEHFTVASLLLTSFTVASPPPRVRLVGISLDIEQTFLLGSLERPDAPPVERLGPRQRIFRLDAAHPPSDHALPPVPPTSSTPTTSRYLAELTAGQDYHFRHLSRLPEDRTIRATTLPQTQTPIRVSHQMHFEVMYRVADGPLKFLKIHRDVSLASCCCMLESLVLPEYTVEAAKPRAKGAACVCGTTLHALIKEAEHVLLQPASPPDHLPPKLDVPRTICVT